MRTRNLVRRTHRRFLPLPGPVVFSIVAICLAFSSGSAPAIAAELADRGLDAEVLETRYGLPKTSEATPPAGPTAATDPGAATCSEWISSGPNDPPMLGHLILMTWNPVTQIYTGYYQMEGGSEEFRRFRCDTYEEIDI